MKYLRSVLFWLHLGAGLIAGAIIVIMSVTGVALAYQRQVQAWADRGDWRPAPGTPALGPDDLRAAVAALHPDRQVTSMTLRGSGGLASVALGGPPATTLLMDPQTGAVVPPGPRAAGVRAFFRTMTDWHRWLAGTGERRATGRAVTGAANLIFLFIVLSGLVLWWPRQLSRRAFSAALWFGLRLKGRARDFNWHNTIGFWSAIPLAIVVASGVVISYGWAGNLVYRLAGEAPPAPARAAATPAPAAAENAAPPLSTPASAPRPPVALAVVLARAKEQVADARSVTIRLPANPTAPFLVTIDRGDGGQPQLRGTLTVDAGSGRVVKWEPFDRLSAGRRWRSYLRFAHTGEVLGLAGQTVAALVSAGAVVLAWTGVALALRRLAAWIRRRRKTVTDVAGRAA